MKTYLLFSSLFLFTTYTYSQEISVESRVVLQDIIQEDSFFVSNPIKVNSEIPTPFIYLSAYSETSSFQGTVFYRNKTFNKWSEWYRLTIVPAEDHSARLAFQGWSVPAHAAWVQFKTTEYFDLPLMCRQFLPGHSEKSTLPSAINRSRPNSCEQPTICDRDCWCPANNCPTDQTPVATTVTHIIVHHSAANTNSDDFPAVVRSYWDFHVNTRGWDDIGYNWLIDANGVIYEGRGEARLGAHFSCMNEETVGICLIGNFEEEKPTQAALDALQQFVAWEAHKGAIDVSTNGYHTSSQLELDFMAGHRDGSPSLLACSSTVCPGDSLYSELPLLRATIAALPCMVGEDSTAVLTSIEEISSSDFRLFPNPNNGLFSISMESPTKQEAFLTLIGIGGKVHPLGNKQIQVGTNTIAFDVSNYPSGIYFLKIQIGEGFIERRFINR